jgi:hypothetical protein
MSDGEKKKIFINPNLFSIENASRKKKPKPEKALRIKSAAKPVSIELARINSLRKFAKIKKNNTILYLKAKKSRWTCPKKQVIKPPMSFNPTLINRSLL